MIEHPKKHSIPFQISFWPAIVSRIVMDLPRWHSQMSHVFRFVPTSPRLHRIGFHLSARRATSDIGALGGCRRSPEEFAMETCGNGKDVCWMCFSWLLVWGRKDWRGCLILGKEDSSRQAESERHSECDDSDLTLGHRKHISPSCSLDHLAMKEQPVGVNAHTWHRFRTYCC